MVEFGGAVAGGGLKADDLEDAVADGGGQGGVVVGVGGGMDVPVM